MPKNQQVAALPWRKGENGIEILLVTTRTSKRWVIPKGWTMDGKADHDAAAIEAYEEAGVRGTVAMLPIGQYGYLKVLASGKPRQVKVEVFALLVDEELQDWPERHERERQWVNLQQARAMIGEPELLPIITDFQGRPVNEAAVPKQNSRLLTRFKKWWRWLFT